MKTKKEMLLKRRQQVRRHVLQSDLEVVRPSAPTAECFTPEARGLYSEVEECNETWRAWDDWCDYLFWKAWDFDEYNETCQPVEDAFFEAMLENYFPPRPDAENEEGEDCMNRMYKLYGFDNICDGIWLEWDYYCAHKWTDDC